MEGVEDLDSAGIRALVRGHTTAQRVDGSFRLVGVTAQILLCVSGAMMMVIIGDSLARAFGIAGAAGIIRFRTPVEDPKDVTILFLLMALGMACGLGAFAVAGLGAAFLCGFLVLLERTSERRPRAITVEIASEGREFPM